MMRFLIHIIIVALFVSILSICAVAALPTSEELKARVEVATAALEDLQMKGVVTYKNKEALGKIDPNYARLYEFKNADIFFKSPDKIRIDGKLGMVKFEYIINSPLKIFRAPSIKFSKRENYADDPAKLHEALDLGLVTASLWNKRKVEVVADSEAEIRGEIKLKLRWNRGDMIYYVWIDAQNLWLKRFEKRDSTNKLKVAIVYSEPKQINGVIWMPTKLEMYTSNGEKAGATDYLDIKVNSGIADKLFQ